MKRLTVHSLREMTDCLRMEDVVYLPKSFDPWHSIPPNASLAQLPWLKAIADAAHANPEELVADYPHLTFVLRLAYDRYRMSHREEPFWIKELNSELKRHLRREYVFGDGFEPLALVPYLPYTGISYAIEEEGVTQEVIDLLSLNRLHYVRQLGFLTDPVVNPEEIRGIGLLFEHSRFCHSLDVMACAMLLGKNTGLSPRLLAHLRFAGLGHDALTPAGGDTTKAIDPPAFDEDAHFPSLLHGPKWEHVAHRHGFERQLLSETVAGMGLLGALLDIADKISYVSRDAHVYVGRYDSHIGTGLAVMPTGYSEISTLLRENPFICGIWDSVEIADGLPVFRDYRRLYKFLLLRALLFRELYYNKGSRFLEYFVVRLALSFFYVRGILTREKLVRMTDSDLEKVFEALFGQPYYSFAVGFSMRPRVEEFSTLDSAEERERALLREGMVTFLEPLKSMTGTGAKFKVFHQGKPTPFGIAYPHLAAHLASILSAGPSFLVYHLPREQLPSSPTFDSLIDFYMESRKTALCIS